MTKLLFLNTAWMKWYDGLDGDKPVNGGEDVTKLGWGFEIFNFRPYQGSMYGYAPAATRERKIRIKKLGASEGQDSVTGILVVWVATRPKGGRYIVGWYADATVFQKEQQPPPQCPNRNLPDGKPASYLVSAPEDNCVLLGVAARAKKLPPRGPGAMGQKALWYAEGATNAQFRQEVLEYIQEKTQQKQTANENLEKHKHGPGGEGPEHKALKNWCAQNPQELGLDDVIDSRMEFLFDSGDRADIKFKRSGNRYAVVEVETRPESAMVGAYQALKYRVLMCAQKGLAVTSDKVLGLLVDTSVPQDVREFCKNYDIEWRELAVPNVQASSPDSA